MRMNDKIRDEKGTILLLWLGFLPFILAGLVLLINVGSILLTQLRLQISADRSAFAAVSSIAYSLNEIAKRNRTLFLAQQKLENDFKTNSQDKEESANNRFKEFMNEKANLDEQMNHISSTMWQRSMKVACDLAHKNIHKDVDILGNEINYEVGCADLLRAPKENERYIELSDKDKQQTSHPKSGNVLGEGGFADPSTYNSKTFNALKYYKKNPNPPSMSVIHLSRRWEPLFLRAFGLGRAFESWGTTLNAFSMGQAFGGDAARYAQTGSKEWLYKPIVYLPEKKQ